MTDKELLLKKSYELLNTFSGHLTVLNQIPARNFSSAEGIIKQKLENGILGIQSLIQKINNFDGSSEEDLSNEKAVIDIAQETVKSLESEDTPTTEIVNTTSTNNPYSDAIVKNLIESSQITPEMQAEEKEDLLVNPILTAFSSYVNDICLKNFGFVALGDKVYNTNIGAQLRGAERSLNDIQINDNTAKLAGLGLIGGALALAYKSLKNKKSYSEYSRDCQNNDIKPISENQYNQDYLAQKLNGYVAANFNNIYGKEYFVTANDIQDLANYSLIKTKEMYESSKAPINFSNSDDQLVFFSYLKDNFNKALSIFMEYNHKNYPFMKNFATMGTPVKQGLIGGLIGVAGLGGLEAMKKAKDYDAYAAFERANGRVPLSKAKWVLLSEEVLNKATLGGVGGAAVGAGHALLKGNKPLEYVSVNATNTGNTKNINNKNSNNKWGSFNGAGADKNNQNILKGYDYERNKITSSMGSKEKRDYFGDGRKLTKNEILAELDSRRNKHKEIYENKGTSWKFIQDSLHEGSLSNNDISKYLSSYDEEGKNLIKRLKDLNTEFRSLNNEWHNKDLSNNKVKSYTAIDKSNGKLGKVYELDSEHNSKVNNRNHDVRTIKNEMNHILSQLYKRNNLGIKTNYEFFSSDDLKHQYWETYKQFAVPLAVSAGGKTLAGIIGKHGTKEGLKSIGKHVGKQFISNTKNLVKKEGKNLIKNALVSGLNNAKKEIKNNKYKEANK